MFCQGFRDVICIRVFMEVILLFEVVVVVEVVVLVMQIRPDEP